MQFKNYKNKFLFLILFFNSLLFAETNNYSGSLRVIVDFGTKYNISIKPCISATKNDFVFTNDSTTDNGSDIILNQPSLNTLYFCSVDLENSTSTNYKYKNFKPTIIMFNDAGIKGTPSLYNKKLLSSSNINSLLLSYKQSDNIGEFYNQLSKFSIDHFYLAITPDLYSSNTLSSGEFNINNFYEFLNNLPTKIKDDKIAEQEFSKKITYIKELYKFSFALYEKLLIKYNTLTSVVPNYYLDMWQSGFTYQSFCNYTSSYTDSLGYAACSEQGDAMTCYTDNCLGGSSSINYDNTDSLANAISQAQYGQDLSGLQGNSSSSSIFNFKKIPYTNITSDIVKNSDGSIDEASTLANRNIECRSRIEKNLAKTFDFYSKKMNFQNINSELLIDMTQFPIISSFSNVLLDIHSNLVTNDIGAIIDELKNVNCISGEYSATDFNKNKKVLSYVNIVKNNGDEFFNYFSKIFASNLQTGTNTKSNQTIQTSINDTTTNEDGEETITGGGMTSNTEATIDTNTTTTCASDESVLVLFFDSLSKNLQNSASINTILNSNIAKTNKSFFDVQNYQLYIGCYKSGYVTKFLGKLPHTTTESTKTKLLNCYNKWLNESDSSSSSTTASNTTGVCLDYFYNDLQSSDISFIYSKLNDKTKDNVIFGSIAHFNVYNSSALFNTKLNGPTSNSTEYTAASGTFNNTEIFKNIIPTIPYSNFLLERYDLRETVCEKTKEFDTNTTKDTSGNNVTTITKGSYKCNNNVSLQPIYNYKHTYNYKTQDYMMVLNSYSPIKLSNVSSLSESDKNLFTLSENYPAYSTSLSKNETFDCPYVYLDITSLNETNYVNDMKTCLGSEVFSDFNTIDKTFLKSKFTNLYIQPIIDYASSLNINLTQSLSEEQFYTYQFPADVSFLYKPAFTLKNGFTDNDKFLYEIEQDKKSDIINVIKSNNTTTTKFNMTNDVITLFNNSNVVDTTKYDIVDEYNIIDITNFSEESKTNLVNTYKATVK